VRRSKTVLQWIRGHIGYTGLRADPRWLIFRGFTGLGCSRTTYERGFSTTASTAAREHDVDDEMHRFSATKKDERQHTQRKDTKKKTRVQLDGNEQYETGAATLSRSKYLFWRTTQTKQSSRYLEQNFATYMSKTRDHSEQCRRLV